MSTPYHHGTTAFADGSARADEQVDRLVRVACRIVFALLSGIAALFAASTLSQMRAPVAAHDGTLLAPAGALTATIVALTAAQRVLFDLRWLVAAAPLAGLFVAAGLHQPTSRWISVPLIVCGFLLGHLFLLRERWTLHRRSDLLARRPGWSGVALTSAAVIVAGALAATLLRRPPLQRKLDALEHAWNGGDLEGLVELAPRAQHSLMKRYLERIAREQRWGAGSPTVTGRVHLSSDVARPRELFGSADERFVAIRTLEGSPLLLETTWAWGGDDWLLVSLALRPPS